MTLYIALLRGINVGGKHLVKMAELKTLLESIGLRRVKTYIQSGNVVFESEESADSLQGRLEAEFLQAFGFPSTFVLRTLEEWESLIQNCPYPPDALPEGDSIYLSLLTHEPTPEDLAKLPDLREETDEYRFAGREIYMLFHQKISDSKLPAKLLKMGVPTTTRNWNTVLKLAALASALQK